MTAVSGAAYDVVLLEESFGTKTDHGTGHLDLATFPLELARLRDWVDETESGDRAELPDAGHRVGLAAECKRQGLRRLGAGAIAAIGRLGYAADRVLLYIAGGAAFVSSETSIPTTGISFGGDDTRVGWTVGGGLDYAFTKNWFTGVEYRCSQFQSKSFIYPIPVLNLGLIGLKQDLSNNQVTARIGYKF